MFQLRKFFCLLWLLALSCSAAALPEDAQQIMSIVADASVFNYKTGTHTYEGNVKIDQGTTHIIADRVITHNNSKHKIAEAIAYGLTHLAEYTTLPKVDDPILHAKARVIKFYPYKSLAILENEVTVTQGNNSFAGPLIIYNMKDQIVTAPASKTGRATVVIEPSQLKS